MILLNDDGEREWEGSVGDEVDVEKEVSVPEGVERCSANKTGEEDESECGAAEVRDAGLCAGSISRHGRSREVGREGGRGGPTQAGVTEGPPPAALHCRYQLVHRQAKNSTGQCGISSAYYSDRVLDGHLDSWGFR
ncbi:hypothetical protein E2C01_035220 [Portunus trituberculatus]|uniref:Uncharacterized protein n=1 Tax=Portunus trituberculatus TaxID=210409 RepID=A0A5B7F2L9_PORTR|nr:hypothetical protein [Portunus trituberculatus]